MELLHDKIDALADGLKEVTDKLASIAEAVPVPAVQAGAAAADALVDGIDATLHGNLLTAVGPLLSGTVWTAADGLQHEIMGQPEAAPDAGVTVNTTNPDGGGQYTGTHVLSNVLASIASGFWKRLRI